MSIVITPGERDALYDQILIRLSGIDGVFLAVRKEEFKTAERLAREFSDDLRFVVDDLGFGEGPGGPVQVRTPPDVLRRVLERLAARAKTERQTDEDSRAEAEQAEAKSALVEQTCHMLLAALNAV